MKDTARWSAAALLALSLAVPATAQQRAPDLSGMWSDPPATLEDTFCMFFCTQPGLDKLEELLADEANDDRSVPDLFTEAAKFQLDTYLKPRLTAEAIATLGLDPADDPGFLECEPWAFAREILAPHQLEIEQRADRVEMLYGEWTVRRTVHLDGRSSPTGQAATPMGYSVGRYEAGTLVVETTHIAANLAPWGLGFPVPLPFDGRHSDQLSAVERYTRSDDGERLLLSVTLEDPWALREPVTLKKVWAWAPAQEIAPYDSCEPPTEFSRGVSQP
jgi:hypothetical protein